MRRASGALASVLLGITSVVLPVLAHAAAVTALDHFIVTRSDIVGGVQYEGQGIYYADRFDDGQVPPQGGSFVPHANPNPIYFVTGSYPLGAESGGKLQLNSSLGAAFIGAGGVMNRVQTSILNADVSTNPDLGLKPARGFAVYGLFDAAVPPQIGDAYSILLNNVGIGAATESLNLGVRRQPDNTVAVRLVRQDFVAGTITQLDLDPFAPPTGADQIELAFFHVPNEALITGGYRFWDDGTALGTFTLLSPAAAFFTDPARLIGRPGFTAFESIAPVPEPGTLVLLSVGLALVVAGKRAGRVRLAARVGQPPHSSLIAYGGDGAGSLPSEHSVIH